MKSRPELDPRAPDRGLGGMLIGALAMIVILGLVYVWAPSVTRTAEKTQAGTTVGQDNSPQAKLRQTTPSTNR
jgi:hypothetical protein